MFQKWRWGLCGGWWRPAGRIREAHLGTVWCASQAFSLDVIFLWTAYGWTQVMWWSQQWRENRIEKCLCTWSTLHFKLGDLTVNQLEKQKWKLPSLRIKSCVSVWNSPYTDSYVFLNISSYFFPFGSALFLSLFLYVSPSLYASFAVCVCALAQGINPRPYRCWAHAFHSSSSIPGSTFLLLHMSDWLLYFKR